MARAQGARAQMALAYETVYGTPPVSGFQRGTHANWQLVTNDGTGAPTLTDMGAPFALSLIHI